MYLVMVIAFGVLLASSLLLVVLNYKIYLPLRKFTSQFSDSRENEISIIENEIHDLLSEIKTLSQHSKEQIPEKIALHYLLCGGSQLVEGSLKLLEEKYPYYMIMALAIQKDSGIEDLLFTSSLEKTLTSQFALKFISLDKFSFALLARPEDKEEILAGLQEAAEEASKTTRLFAGIREYCTDIRELQTEYRLAENCLLSAQVLPMENFAFQENAAVLPRKRLGQEVQNRLFEYARKRRSGPASAGVKGDFLSGQAAAAFPTAVSIIRRSGLSLRRPASPERRPYRTWRKRFPSTIRSISASSSRALPRSLSPPAGSSPRICSNAWRNILLTISANR